MLFTEKGQGKEDQGMCFFLYVLVDVSDVFIFFCSGERNREPEAPDDFLIENSRRGGSRAGGGGGAGEGLGGRLRGIWGGG